MNAENDARCTCGANRVAPYPNDTGHHSTTECIDEATGHVIPPAATACISCTVDQAERVECMAWDDECLTCHLTRCRECQDDLADQATAEARSDGRWS